MKIVYVVGGLLHPNGMSQVLSEKINYLAERTNFEIYMILTEKKTLHGIIRFILRLNM